MPLKLETVGLEFGQEMPLGSVLLIYAAICYVAAVTDPLLATEAIVHTMIKIAEILHIAAFSQAFLLAVYFLRYRRLPGYVPFALLAVSVIGLVSVAYLYLSDLVFHLPTMAVLGFPLLAAMGPLFYIGVRSVLEGKTILRPADMAFFLVTLFELGQLMPFFLSSQGEKVAYLGQDLSQMHAGAMLRCFLALANNVLFVGLAAASLIKRERFGEESNDGRRKLLHLCFLMLAFYTAFLSLLYDAALFNRGFGGSLFCLIFLVFTYLLVSRSRLHMLEIQGPSRQYARDRMADDRVSMYGNRIREHLESRQPFTEPDFRISSLAGFLGLSNNQTSQVINRHFQKSYAELIGQYRVDTASRMLQDPEHMGLTIAHTALDCGFNSQSSFNTLFKRHFGVTPRAWRDSNAG